VLASHWKVSDNAASQLMTEFIQSGNLWRTRASSPRPSPPEEERGTNRRSGSSGTGNRPGLFGCPNGAFAYSSPPTTAKNSVQVLRPSSPLPCPSPPGQ
jgi:hypothetical protein